MVVRENVAEQQRHPNLSEGGHASAHDPHPSLRHAPRKVLPQNAQQLVDGLLIETQGLAPPLAELIALALL